MPAAKKTEPEAEADVVEPEAPEAATEAEVPRGYCKARITKMGDQKVATGGYDPNIGYLYYDKNEIVTLPLPVALALEGRGFAEIED